MPRYLLRFKVETCLTYEKDLAVEFGGHQSVLLFSKKTSDDGHVIAQIEVEANNNEQAWVVVASNFLPPILDALSFATGTPLLLRDCELILKDEAGNAKRRVLYIGHRHVPSVVHLRDGEIEEMKTILATGDDFGCPSVGIGTLLIGSWLTNNSSSTGSHSRPSQATRMSQVAARSATKS